MRTGLKRFTRSLKAVKSRFGPQKQSGLSQARGHTMDYEALLEKFYRGLDLNGKTVIDIGAHLGRHTIPFSDLVGDKGCVMAFEPIPDIRAALLEKLDSHGINNVAVLPFALSDHSGSDNFVYVPQAPGESGLKRRDIYNSKPTVFQDIRVVVKILDEIFVAVEEIEFIKIDVEGGELDVLNGAKNILSNARPMVGFESGAAAYSVYHNTPEEIYDIFSERDYNVYSILGDVLENREAFAEANVVQSYWDYIALPNEKVDIYTPF